MTSVLAVAVSVLPVFVFLGALVLIDSYKLVALRATLLSVAAGMVAGLAAYGANVWLRPALGLDWDQYSRYVAPVVEELFYRGLWFRAAERRWGTVIGVVVSAVVFGLMHLQPIDTPALIAFGLVTGWLAARYRRIGNPSAANSHVPSRNE